MIIIQSDSHLIINSINGKIEVLKDIINIVEDDEMFTLFLMKGGRNVVLELLIVMPMF